MMEKGHYWDPVDTSGNVPDYFPVWGFETSCFSSLKFCVHRAMWASKYAYTSQHTIIDITHNSDFLVLKASDHLLKDLKMT